MICCSALTGSNSADLQQVFSVEDMQHGFSVQVLKKGFSVLGLEYGFGHLRFNITEKEHMIVPD